MCVCVCGRWGNVSLLCDVKVYLPFDTFVSSIVVTIASIHIVFSLTDVKQSDRCFSTCRPGTLCNSTKMTHSDQN